MTEHYVSHAHLMVYTKYAQDKTNPNRFWDWANEHIRNHLNQNVGPNPIKFVAFKIVEHSDAHFTCEFEFDYPYEYTQDKYFKEWLEDHQWEINQKDRWKG